MGSKYSNGAALIATSKLTSPMLTAIMLWNSKPAVSSSGRSRLGSSSASPSVISKATAPQVISAMPAGILVTTASTGFSQGGTPNRTLWKM